VENASPVDTAVGMVDVGLYAFNSKGKSGYLVELFLDGRQVTTEVEAGSAVPIAGPLWVPALRLNGPLSLNKVKFTFAFTFTFKHLQLKSARLQLSGN